MPKYVIERDIPGAGQWSARDLTAVAIKSRKALDELAGQVQWVHSYVTGDRVYCVYIAANEDLVREHAKRGGFPANRVSMIESIIDPTTAEHDEA